MRFSFYIHFLIIGLQGILRSTAEEVTPSSELLYFYSTSSRLESQIIELLTIWKTVKSYERRIVHTPFESTDFKDVKCVNLCEIFVLPSDIICNTRKYYEAATYDNKNCLKMEYIPNKSIFELTQTDLTKNFSSAPCVISSLTTRPQVFTERVILLPPIEFTDKYVKMLSPAKRPIYTGNKGRWDYTVININKQQSFAHFNCSSDWKNISQELIKSRVDNSDVDFMDYMLNCGENKDILALIDKTVEPYFNLFGQNQHNVSGVSQSYLITNDVSSSSAHFWQNQGFKVFENIIPPIQVFLNKQTSSTNKIPGNKGAKDLAPAISSLDQQVINLMLMCDAKWFFGFGTGLLHDFAQECRAMIYSRRHATFINKQLSLVHPRTKQLLAERKSRTATNNKNAKSSVGAVAPATTAVSAVDPVLSSSGLGGRGINSGNNNQLTAYLFTDGLLEKKVTPSKEPIISLPTAEGLMAQWRKVFILGQVSLHMNRSLLVVPFTSREHYPDVDRVDLCDIFSFPVGVDCFKGDVEGLVRKSRVACVEAMSSFKPTLVGGNQRKLEESKEVKDLDFRSVSCIKGQVTSLPKHPQFPHRGSQQGLPTEKFLEWVKLRPKYNSLLPVIVDYLKSASVRENLLKTQSTSNPRLGDNSLYQEKIPRKEKTPDALTSWWSPLGLLLSGFSSWVFGTPREVSQIEHVDPLTEEEWREIESTMEEELARVRAETTQEYYGPLSVVKKKKELQLAYFEPWSFESLISHGTAPASIRRLKGVDEIGGKSGGVAVAVFHWRRGDQLDSARCRAQIVTSRFTTSSSAAEDRKRLSLENGNVRGARDKSVNCGSVEDFLIETERVLELFHVKQSTKKRLIKYIATNEKDEKILEILRKRGFYIFEDIKPALTQHAKTQKPSVSNVYSLNSVEVFSIELMLMCSAQLFFAWGVSTIHEFIRKCRRFKFKLNPDSSTTYFINRDNSTVTFIDKLIT